MKYRSVRLDADAYAGLVAFRPIAEHVIEQGEHMEIEAVLGLAVRIGLDAMLRDLIGTDAQILAKTIEGLARENPGAVYKFVLDRLRAGDLELGQFVEAWRRMNSKSNGTPE